MRTRLIALTAMLVTVMAVPAQADPPELLDLNLIHVRGDVDHGIVVFWNITRDDLCGWLEGGQVGPRPIEAPLPVSFKETANGAVIVTIRAERVMEVWQGDLSAADPCTATSAQPGPFATGRGFFHYSDNDFFISGSRMNAFGATLQAALDGEDGSTWHYRWVIRESIDLSGEYMNNVNFQLFQVGS